MKTLNPDDSLVIIIDVQEKLVNMLSDAAVKDNAVKISNAAGILGIPVVITEQYPKGLGPTVDEIKTALIGASYFEKTSFDAFSERGFADLIKSKNRKQVLIFGIETHICVLQTAFDCINAGYETFVCECASGSRNEKDKKSALKRLRHAGAQTLTTEQVIFEWLKSSKHPMFKQVQALIK